MRIFTLWKIDPYACRAARLEQEGMPVLFEQAADAEAYGRADVEEWDDDIRIVPVNVGRA